LISLDFLGFSRMNRDLSMGYARFSGEDSSSRLCCCESAVETDDPTISGREKDGLLMAQA
jgi:hypothetical protein